MCVKRAKGDGLIKLLATFAYACLIVSLLGAVAFKIEALCQASNICVSSKRNKLT